MTDPIAKPVRRRNALSVYLDDYGSGLDREHFILAGVAVWSDYAVEQASRSFSMLRRGDERFARKGRKWDPDQWEVFGDYLLGSSNNILPLASVVQLDQFLKRRIKEKARQTRFDDEHAESVRPIQWLLSHVLTETLATASSKCTFAFGRVEHFDIVVDRGNLRPSHRSSYARVASEWTGEFCFDIIRKTQRRSGGRLSEPELAWHRERCAWSAPTLRFEKGGELLRVAEGYTAMVSRHERGEVEAEAVMEHLARTYQYRGPHAAVSFGVEDVTGAIERLVSQ